MRTKWLLLLLALVVVGMVRVPAYGQFWWIFVVDPTNGVGQYTSLDIDSLGWPHITYYDHTRANLCYAYYDGSNTIIDTVEASGNVGDFGSLKLDSLDRPCISYFAGLVSGELRYATNSAGAWSVQVVDAANVRQEYTSLVLEPGTGYPHISYCGALNLRHAWWDGSWHTETVDATQWTGIQSSIALDPTNNNYPCISYVDGWNSALVYAWWDGAVWHFETVDNTPSYTSLTVDPNGVAHIAYSRIQPSPPFPRSLKYARRNGPGNWQTETVAYASTNYGSFPSVAVDRSNNPMISFCDDVAADLVIAYRNGAWSTVQVDYLDRVGQYTSLALKNSVLPCISYYDETNQHPKYAEQVFLDVGVEAILAPPDTVELMGQQVRARIKNFGNVACTTAFAVSCSIDGYSSTVQILPPLAGGEFRDTSFATWDPPMRGTYTMCVTTQLPDENPDNDRLCKNIFVVWHDVGADSILSPPDSVGPSTNHPVDVQVTNYGNVQEIFNVRCWDIGVYSEVVSCTLDAGLSTVLSFPTWLAPGSEMFWSMCCSTQSSLDRYTINDKSCKDIEVVIFHDGGVDSIMSPPDTVVSGIPYPVDAMVHNYGTMPEDSFEVKCEIDGWRDSTWLYSVGPNASVVASFRNWTPSTPGPWSVCVWTLVPGDMAPSNDTLCKDVTVGVEELTADKLQVTGYRLEQNCPNPFSVSTSIRYQVAGNRQLETGNLQYVSVRIHDLTGRLVRSLVDEAQVPGHYLAIWDGRDEGGFEVPQGVYFYRLSVGKKGGAGPRDFEATRKLVVLR